MSFLSASSIEIYRYQYIYTYKDVYLFNTLDLKVFSLLKSCSNFHLRSTSSFLHSPLKSNEIFVLLFWSTIFIYYFDFFFLPSFSTPQPSTSINLKRHSFFHTFILPRQNPLTVKNTICQVFFSVFFFPCLQLPFPTLLLSLLKPVWICQWLECSISPQYHQFTSTAACSSCLFTSTLTNTIVSRVFVTTVTSSACCSLCRRSDFVDLSSLYFALL